MIKLILFGSYAKGENDNESDIDMMALINEEPIDLNKFEGVLTDITVELELKYGISISIIDTSWQNYQKYIDVLPFYMNINREGVVLYG